MFASQPRKFPILDNLTSYPFWLSNLSWHPKEVVSYKLKNTDHKNVTEYQVLEQQYFSP